MAEFKAGDKVRVNEGLLEGETGVVVESEVADNITAVQLDSVTYTKGPLMFYTDTLVKAAVDHEALAHLKKLYPDFLKSDSYRYRLTTFVNGIMYHSSVPLDAETLVDLLERKPPVGLHAVEFMLKKDDPYRGLAWKVLWSL